MGSSLAVLDYHAIPNSDSRDGFGLSYAKYGGVLIDSVPIPNQVTNQRLWARKLILKKVSFNCPLGTSSNSPFKLNPQCLAESNLSLPRI